MCDDGETDKTVAKRVEVYAEAKQREKVWKHTSLTISIGLFASYGCIASTQNFEILEKCSCDFQTWESHEN